MMKAFFGRVAAILDQVRTWGVRLPSAGLEAGPTIRVLGPGDGAELRLVGTLWQERGEFFFRYDPSFAKSGDAEPISAFPELDETYSSHELWPFFAVRIPPVRRADVREALERHGLKPEQTLEVLGTIAKKSISNPYELDLVREGKPGASQAGDPVVKGSSAAPMHPAT